MRIITLDLNKKIISVKENYPDDWVLGENEIASNVGEMGQIQQEDGSFITPEPTEATTKPITLEELQANQLTIMNAIADLYAALPTSTTATTT